MHLIVTNNRIGIVLYHKQKAKLVHRAYANIINLIKKQLSIILISCN